MTEQVERLIERLRTIVEAPYEITPYRALREAADMLSSLSAEKAALECDMAIERSVGQEQINTLSSQLAEARGALEPFAAAAGRIAEGRQIWVERPYDMQLVEDHFIRAAAVMAALALPAEQGEE